MPVSRHELQRRKAQALAEKRLRAPQAAWCPDPRKCKAAGRCGSKAEQAQQAIGRGNVKEAACSK